MSEHPLAVTPAEANAPKPKPPQGIRAIDWLNYYDALACWIATKADQISFGVKEQK